MRRLLLPAVFVLLLALNVAGYFYLAFDLNGSKVETRQSLTHTKARLVR
jgi:hypothetical protein